MTKIRRAVADDYDAYAELFLELAIEDPVPTRAEWLEHFAPYTWVAIEAGAVIGYCYVQALEHNGHVQNIVVARRARRAGIARALMATAAAWFRARGLAVWALNVRSDNRAARTLYESLGFRRVHSAKLLRLAWDAAKRLPVGTGVVRALPSERDGEMERLLALPGGTLARLRGRGRTPYEVVSASAALLGFAVLDANYPRLRPLRILERGALASLLGAAQAQVRPSEHVYLLVEQDDALAELLQDAGAELRQETFYMRGPL